MIILTVVMVSELIRRMFLYKSLLCYMLQFFDTVGWA